MPCCSRKKTHGTEPQSRRSSEPSSEKLKPITTQKTSIPTIEYEVTVKTGNNRNSNTDGPVYIKIIGRDDKQTEDILLANSPNEKSFQQDSLKKFQIKAIDIGKPQRIIIRHEDQKNEWFIDYVEISVHNFLIRFVANRWLSQSKHDRKLSAELYGSEQIAEIYNIEVQTGSEQTESLDSPVYVQIHGTTTITPKLFLEPKTGLFTKDSTTKFNITSNNVGEIQKVIIGHEGIGTINDWYLQHVKIHTDTQQQKFIVNKWLSPTKGDKKLFIELTHQQPKEDNYFVTVQTGDVEHSETIENIQMSIHGTNGQIDKIFLKDHTDSNQNQLYQKGSSDQFEIKHEDIGNIKHITIGFNDNQQKSAWLLESVEIKYKDIIYHFQADCWLSNRLGANFTSVTLKPDANNDDVNYKVIIETGESGIDANVILCIYGDKEITKNLALRTTKSKFEKNSQLEFDVKAVDVGKIKKINIGHDGKGNEQKWFLKSIKVVKKDEHYIFSVNQWLSEEKKNFIDLSPEEAKPKVLYTITTVTSSEDDSATDSGVFLTMYGEHGQIKQLQLTKTNSDSLFQQGKTDQFQFELDDIGKIHKINIGQDGKGLHPIWHLDTVEIQTGTEIYKFTADKILDFSMPDVDLIPNPPEKPPSPEPEKVETPRSTKSDKKQQMKETIYKVSIRYNPRQQSPTDDDNNLYMVIIGENGKTKKLSLAMNKSSEIELAANDVGKISKILLGQDESKRKFVWHVDSIIIKRENEITTFNVERSIEPNTEIELTPSPIRKPSETPTNVVKTKDVDYEIRTTTGEKDFEGGVIIKIRGDYGIISIPLSKTRSGEKPFQSKANDAFTTRTANVGKIKRVIVELDSNDNDHSWHLTKLQILKGNETYNFKTNIRFDDSEKKVTLYPIDQKKEDYVQSELRRLRENLRSESSKLRRPRHKPHEPFVYNDLSPYFDTTNVEKAINEPLDSPVGYYTRLTALRVVEPWEAYGMDYGVNYELLKERRVRGPSAKRSITKTDESIDRTQGSTHLPEYPCVDIRKPIEYQRTLTTNDVPKIRSFVRARSTSKADSHIDKDYKRTREDIYRMQLDNVSGYHGNNRDNMVRAYHSYLENTPGSKKALRELCDQISLNTTKTTVDATPV